MKTLSAAISSPPGPLSSQVVTDPLATQVLGASLFGAGLLGLLGGGLWGWYVGWWPGGALGLVLGAGLLAGAWLLAQRTYYPLRLTLTAKELQLAPMGRSVSQGVPPETIPLTEIRAYSHWLSQGRVLAQYYLRLELAGGRVLRLADRPGALPDDPPGTVLLEPLVQALAQRLPATAVVRPPFYQSAAARRLAVGAWVAVGVSGWLAVRVSGPAAFAVVLVAGSYLAVYYQRRRAAAR
ncbi:hypothetical protein HHL22_07270 [Hymenobacter sp. RP-2-7]|uniref:Uncharacterized protein n=1 Tax=Hymenobacter polaris TaxID=2682546 RepID=A0A7Y0ACW8_9BACT|nr:hypothetical protein [Hymenobacter polaris]NML65004.1 hypothetical protein [Hymenobacter polaris]